jgi:hypothetical protein
LIQVRQCLFLLMKPVHQAAHAGKRLWWGKSALKQSDYFFPGKQFVTFRQLLNLTAREMDKDA